MDTGDNDIAVDLLDHEDHDRKIKRIDRIIYKEDDGTWNCADERTEDGDDIGDADDNADQRRIGQSKNLHQKEANKINDPYIQKLF